MRDDRLERDVSDELRWDPKVDEKGIAVHVDEGDVTLRGTVGSLAPSLPTTTATENPSSTNEALAVTSPSSTPSCSTMICFTFSSTAAMFFLACLDLD